MAGVEAVPAEKVKLEKATDRLHACGIAVAAIAVILKDCKDTAEARRIIIAAGLTAGVYDIDDDDRIVPGGGGD